MADRRIPGVASTSINPGLAKDQERGIYRAAPLGRRDEDPNEALASVRALQDMFGANINVENRHPIGMSMGALDRFGTRGHPTTGIPYAISGTAELVEIDVGERLMAFSDPIRAILGTGVHTSQKVMIKRQYATGGGASAVPERAPARTIGLAEDVREVVLTRYGADIEWNLNLLARPADFQKEMTIKLNAQKESLQMELVKMAYDTLMTEGTSLVSALVASSPDQNHNPLLAQQNAERIYVSSVFGAMQRFNYPVHNLIAAAKYATNFTISQADKTVMIVPYGMPELHKYTKPENMVSYIHGVQHGDPLTAEVTGGAVDTATNTTVYVHRPPMSYMHGAANPVSEGPLLASEVVFGTAVNIVDDDSAKVTSIYDHLRRSKIPFGDDAKLKIRVYTATMHSAILGIPSGAGQETGEMLVGYPSTMVGSDVSTEIGRMRLRMYLGCALYRPENVMILPDVGWGGLHSIETVTLDSVDNLPSSFRIHVVANAGGNREVYVQDPIDGQAPKYNDGPGGAAGPFKQQINANAAEMDILEKINGQIVYTGAHFVVGASEEYVHNNGHLGSLDHPDTGDRVFGNFVYRSDPSPTR